MFLVSGGVVPDRWDAEVVELWGAFAREAVRRGTPPGAHMNLGIIANLARRAYREGLEHARGVALDAAGEYPEDIFRPIEPGELTNISAPVDRIGAHMARVAARNIAATIRREIEGL